MAEVIQLCIDYIRNDDADNLGRMLKLIPLETLTTEKTDDLLEQLLSVASEFDRKDQALTIFQEWLRVYPEYAQQRFPLISTLFTNFRFGTELLQFCVSLFPDYTYIELMDDLIRSDASYDVPRACRIGIEVFGEQSPQTYVDLLDLAKDTNDRVADFMEDKVRENAEYADVPTWIKDYRASSASSSTSSNINISSLLPLPFSSSSRSGSQEPLPLEKDLKPPPEPQINTTNLPVPDIETAVNLLTEGLTNIGITIEDIEYSKQVLRTRLLSSTLQERAELLQPVMQLQVDTDKQDDPTLFRILGPSNPLVGSDLDEMEYGGCRMFTCSVFDYNEDTGFTEYWFTGSCFQCLRKIRYYWHAVRQPRQMGGWIGCYCSWMCVRNRIRELPIAEIAGINMAYKFEADMYQIGIQDRRPNPNPRPAIIEDLEDDDNDDDNTMSSVILRPSLEELEPIARNIIPTDDDNIRFRPSIILEPVILPSLEEILPPAPTSFTQASLPLPPLLADGVPTEDRRPDFGNSENDIKDEERFTL